MKNVRFLVSTAILVAIILGADAHGQGAAAHDIPDPISTTDLLRFADRLTASEEQRQALKPFHDAYMEKFRLLREGEIDRFVEEMQKHGGRASIGTRLWDENSKRRNSILAQIRALDDALFADIEAILTEEQRGRMPRVRMARQRDRVLPMAQKGLTLSVRTTDLSDVVLDVAMSGAERKRIDPLLLQYEQQLTRMLEEYPAIIIAMRRDLSGIAEDFRREMQEDPANQKEASDRLMARSHEAQLASQEHAVGMRALGRKMLFEITPHLSDRTARQLRSHFISRTYFGSIHSAIRSYVEEALDAVLDRDDLDEMTFERISELDSTTTRRVEAIVREALEAIDEREKSSTSFNVLERDRDDGQNLERTIRERINAVEDPVIAELMELLSEEAALAFVQALPRDRRPAGAVVPPPPPPDPEAQAAMEAHRAARQGGIVPSPISASNVAEYRRALEADEEQRARIEEMHAQYTLRIAETVTHARREIVQFYSPERGDPTEFVARNAELRGRAIEATENADRSFFDALAEMFPDRTDVIDRIRLRRERQRYTISPMARMWIMSMDRRIGYGPADIDLSELARRQNIDFAASSDADQAFMEYERELTRLFRETHAATLEVSDLSTISFGLFMLRDQNPEGLKEEEDAARAALKQAERRLAEAERAIVELNRRAIDELVAALVEQDGAALLAAYRERAFPQVYRDLGAMEDVLTRTLQMDDLNSAQRDGIAELLAEYRAAYANLTARMHEIVEQQELERDSREQGSSQPGTAARLREQFEKLRHDREELNARTILNLEGILNETQLARLGPMPDPTLRPQPRMWD